MALSTADRSDLDLTSAFESGEFEAFYQPQIDVLTGELVGVEAVARWRHPRLGLLKPNLFLDHVRMRGRFADFTRTMLARAIHECAAWRKGRKGLKITVAINISGTDVIDPTFMPFLSSTLKAAKLPSNAITLEIPELDISGLDREMVSIGLLALRTLGCGIAMEARGPIFNPEDGSNLPLTQLKVGGAAILRFASAFQEARIGVVHKRLEWARQHGLQTVAVGAESASALRALATLGFDRVQCDYLAPASDRCLLADHAKSDFKARIDLALSGQELVQRIAAATAAEAEAVASDRPYVAPRKRFGDACLSLKSVDITDGPSAD
jgi:EAL domain-containing protein (putative c-di-GMP-specific phosphodiesterase class I)